MLKKLYKNEVNDCWLQLKKYGELGRTYWSFACRTRDTLRTRNPLWSTARFPVLYNLTPHPSICSPPENQQKNSVGLSPENPHQYPVHSLRIVVQGTDVLVLLTVYIKLILFMGTVILQ
jgi:hypothetical protein